MLKRLWNQCRREDRIVDEAVARLRATSGYVTQLDETVRAWLDEEVSHESFVDAYRVWLTGFAGVDGEMWNADRAASRRLLTQHDEALRRALAVRHAIVQLIAEGHAITAPSEAKHRQYAAALASSLGEPLTNPSPPATPGP